MNAASRVALLVALSSTLWSQQPALWREPANISALDFEGGVGGRTGAPRPPFAFLKEETSGTQAKVIVRDARGAKWIVKWGPEAKAEVFSSRLVWAMGYHTEPSYLVRGGVIRNARKLQRADKWITDRGAFRDARFERMLQNARFHKEYDWTWSKNPFVGTHQLNGLKILVMLLSNWDNKDGRDATSNTAIIEVGTGPGRIWKYGVTDWGGTMGKWGNFITRENWNCEDYREQTDDFIKEIEDGEVRFGYSGKHDDQFKDDITVADVRWLVRHLGRVTDAQIRAGLLAAGANRHEVACFSRSLRNRIKQLERIPAARVGTRSRIPT